MSALLFRTVRTVPIKIFNPDLTPISSTVSSLTPVGRLETNFHRITLTGIDYNGLLNDSSSAINDVKQRLRNQPVLQGRSVGLAIVFGGAASVNDIPQAQKVDVVIYTVLKDLGKQGFAFQKSSYYDPLYTLGDAPGTINIDTYLFSSSSSGQTSIGRLDFNPVRITLTGIDYEGLLNNSPSAINDVKQRLRRQSVLQGRSVGLAMVYGSAPTDANISQAEKVSAVIYTALKDLGKQGFAFQKSSYYDRGLYTLGSDAATVSIDVYLFIQ